MTRGVAVARRCRRAGWCRGELGRVRRVPPLPTSARRKATGRVAVAGVGMLVYSVIFGYKFKFKIVLI